MTRSSNLLHGAERVAMVTGASSGIGFAIARSLLNEGLHVICAARSLDKMNFSEYGDRALPLRLDVTDRDAVGALPGTLPSQWQDVNILVANAGSNVGGGKRFDEGSVSDWTRTIDTNLTGLITLCHAMLPGMLRRGEGHVVSIGSVASTFTYPGGAAYSASKYGARALFESLRQDYKASPIRITEILPGFVKTGFARARYRGDAELAETFYDKLPGHLTPSDVAASVLFALNQPKEVNIAQIVVTPTSDK